MAWLYILFSDKDDQFYIGQTERDVDARFSDHIKGYVQSTKHRRPLLLAYAEFCQSVTDVRKREWHLKHPKGFLEKKKLLEMIVRRKDEWPIRIETK